MNDKLQYNKDKKRKIIIKILSQIELSCGWNVLNCNKLKIYLTRFVVHSILCDLHPFISLYFHISFLSVFML